MSAPVQASDSVATAAIARAEAAGSPGQATPTGSTTASQMIGWQIEGTPPVGEFTVTGKWIYLSKGACESACQILKDTEERGYTWKPRLVRIVGAQVA